jgi:protein SCO1/2
LINGASQLEWSAGAEFDVVAFSINPEEPWQLARAKRDGYAIDYVDKSRKEGFARKPKVGERPQVDSGSIESGNEEASVTSAGWTFLADHDDSARNLCEAIGFNYRLVPETGEYSHAACLVLCTPDGRISRYLYGSYYPINDLKLALVEAGQGKVGSAFDRFLLWCHRYDKDKGYVKSALQIMKLGGVATIIIMAGGLFVLWRADLRSHRKSADDIGYSGLSTAGSHS